MSARRSSPTQLNSSIASSETADKDSAPLAKAARLGRAAFFAASGCFVDQRDLKSDKSSDHCPFNSPSIVKSLIFIV